MKMPTKSELLRLQKIYRTDKKIAEALGGIEEYLVAYWRRKKGIPKPSFAKYSEAQIRELWERFGDDFHCGRELGISKAAFYSWRRRYNIKEKPQALKLEQLELRFGWETKMGRNGVHVEYYQTAYQKILARTSNEQTVQPGDIVRLNPDLVILPEKYAELKADKKIEPISWWAKEFSLIPIQSNQTNSSHVLDNVFDSYWRGLIRPNLLIVTTYPELHALGAYSTAVVSVDQKHAEALLSNAVDFKVPKLVKVNITGRLIKTLSVVDLMGFYIKQLSAGSFKNKMVEYSGSGVEKLSGEEKMALCYFTRLAGAESAFCLFDESARKSLARHAKVNYKIYFSDRTAHYEAEYLLNSVGLENYIFPGGKIDSPEKVCDAGAIKPDVVFIGGPLGGTVGLLKSISDLARNKKIDRNITCYVSPLTQADFKEAVRKKYIANLVEFGCQVLPVGMSLNEFLAMSGGKGKILSVPCLLNNSKELDLDFCSAKTAIRTACEGRLV